MPLSVSVPENISTIAELIQTGDARAAKKLFRLLLNTAGQREVWLLGHIADEMEKRPRTAAAFLRHMLDTAPTEADRAIIAACTPKDGQQRRRPEPTDDRQPRWNAGNKYQAASTVQRRQMPEEMRQRRNTRQEQSDFVADLRYRDQRAGVIEGAQPQGGGDDRADANQVYASGLDYDRAALVAVRGLPCLHCRAERHDTATRADGDVSGLCEDCEKPWRKGLEPLSDGHTRADILEARCTWLVEHFPRPRGVLYSEWRSATGTGDRDVIGAWVADWKAARPTCVECLSRNSVAPLETDDGGAPVETSPLVCGDCRKEAEKEASAADGPAEPAKNHNRCDRCGRPGAPIELCARCDQQTDDAVILEATARATVPGDCDGCGSLRQVRDGLCPDCRKLTDEVEETMDADTSTEIPELVAM